MSKLKRFKKVVKYDEIGLGVLKFTLHFFGTGWVILTLISSLTPDIYFLRGRLIYFFTMSLIISIIPITISVLLWLGREVYWEEIK